MTDSASTTAGAILGLLRLRPYTTYELAKQVQRSIGWFWPRAERKLYDEPKRLVGAGLATGEREMTGARPRTVYSVTPAGRRALKRWLGEAPVPPQLEFEGLVKVFFADGGTLAQLRATLDEIASQADERVADLLLKAEDNAAGRTEYPARLPLNTLALRFQLDHERQIGSWARWARAQTEGWRSPTDPGDWDFRRVLD